MKNLRTLPGLTLGLALLALSLPAPALAERYRVDLILFADNTAAAGEQPVAAQAPNLTGALDLGDTAKLRAAGIEILPDESFGLAEAWKRLRNSRNHEPLLRLAWLQKDPPAERGVSLRLRWGKPGNEPSRTGGAVYPVDGTVALLVGRFLHLDADLAFTRADDSGVLGSFRLNERRRLRRDELHHLDSPRLGLLVRAQRAEEKDAAPATRQAPQPAPTPVPKRAPKPAKP